MNKQIRPNNLKHLRFLKGYHTARAFASAVGVTPVIISCWERGTHVPSLSSVNKLLRVLGCNYDDLGFNTNEQ